MKKIAAALTAALVGTALATSAAGATGPTPFTNVTTEVPVPGTPSVNDGMVQAYAESGDRVYAGGTFTSVNSTPRSGLMAMSRSAGFSLVGSFAPTMDGEVRALLPGPTAGSVYVGGTFTTVNGQARRGLVLLDQNGNLVSSFNFPAINGVVNSIGQRGTQLVVGGTFTKVGAAARGGLVSVDAATGAVTGMVANVVTENHNYTGSGAKAAVGVTDLVVMPDGRTVVAIGNFRKVDGLDRDQIVMLDVSSGQSVVKPDWKTNGYTAACFNWAFDTYVRDVDVAPDGSFFVVAATGGGVANTLCDTIARFETSATGSDVQPTWANYSGGDTFFSVAASRDVVYAGGHQRWANNPHAADYAGAGAVPRPGLVAMDARTGMPIAWNAARNPRGVGAKSVYLGSDGLWVGSDTTYIGNRQYLRPRVALLPIGTQSLFAQEGAASLPAGLYVGKAAPSAYLYRVNVGGGQLGSLDGGPDWMADDNADSPYRNSGSSTAGWSAVPALDSSVPATTPRSIFDSERWDPGSDPEMAWHFPVPAGKSVNVRLYFANRYDGTSTVGSRIFDVAIDDTTVLPDFDVVASANDQTGTMRSFSVTSDGTVDISFRHIVENPMISGIEIVSNGAVVSTSSLTAYRFSGTAVSGATPGVVDLEPATVRGSVAIGSRLFYGRSDGEFAWRPIATDGALGAPTLIDPYNDPKWADVSTGSGQTYRGVRPNFYADIPAITSMFYDNGRLYYTLSGSNGLFWRSFSPDSGTIHPDRQQVASVTMPQVTGAFLTGGKLYYATAADGRLNVVDFEDGQPSGTPTPIIGIGIDGVDFNGRLLYLYGHGPTTPPTAAFSATCSGATCAFDGRATADPDGSVASYVWNFGDGTTGTGATLSHTYPETGTYDVTLSVTDNDGAQASTTQAVSVVAPANVPPVAAATASCTDLDCTFSGAGSSDPDGAISSYSWDFGDGTSGSGIAPTHAYPSGGSYEAVLTVTDNRGTTDTASVSVSVTAPAGIAFVGASQSAASAKKVSVAIPAGTQTGDQLVLVVSTVNATTQMAPTGWTRVSDTNATSLRVGIWQRTATASDLPGGTVTVTADVWNKQDAKLVAYRGAAPVSQSGAATAAKTRTVTAPAVPVTVARSWVVRVFADRSGAVTTATLSAGTVARVAAFGTGTGHIDAVLGDSGAQVNTGTAPAATATLNATASVAAGFSLVLPPSP